MGKSLTLIKDASQEYLRARRGRPARFSHERLDDPDDARAASALTARVFLNMEKIAETEPDGTLIDTPEIAAISNWYATFDRFAPPAYPEDDLIGRAERKYGGAMVAAVRLLHDKSDGPPNSLYVPLQDMHGEQVRSLEESQAREVGEISGLVKANKSVSSFAVLSLLHAVVKSTRKQDGTNSPRKLIFATGTKIAPVIQGYFGEEVIRPLTDEPLTRPGIAGKHYSYVADLDIALDQFRDARHGTFNPKKKALLWVLEKSFDGIIGRPSQGEQRQAQEASYLPRPRRTESIVGSRTSHHRVANRQLEPNEQ